MNDTDGKVIIGTEIDLKGIDKGIQEVEKKIKKLTDKAIIKDERTPLVEFKTNLTKDEEKYLERLQATREELYQQKIEALGLLDAQEQINEIAKSDMAINGKETEFVGELTQKYNELLQYVEEYKELQKQPILTDQEIENSEILKNNIILTAKELEKMTGQQFHIKGITDIVDSVPKVNLSLGKVIKKITKWGLALLGIRSAYLGIRRIINQISQEDKNIANNIKYLNYAISNLFKPLVKWLYDALFEIVALIARMIYLISGKNIFENSGIKDFEKSLKKSSGSAKELNKQLAGFDEMNVLGSQNTGSGFGGITAQDLSKVAEQETNIEKATANLVDKWIRLGEEMKNALDNPEMFKEAYGNWGKFIEGVVNLFHGLWDIITGTAEVVGGLLDFIVGIFTGNKQKILAGTEEFFKGLIRIVMGILESLKGIFQMAIGAIAGIFTTLWDLIKKGAVKAWEGIKNVFSKFGEFFYNIFNSAWTKVKKLFSQGGKIFTGIKDGIVNSFKAIVNALISGINKIIATPFQKINALLNKIRTIEILGAKPFKGLWDKNPLPVPQIPKLARGGIVNNPGNGVMMGNYIAGERGPEAVIPLDEKTMDRLGEAIARHMNITNDNKIYMNAREIARQVNVTNAEHQFAYNG